MAQPIPPGNSTPDPPVDPSQAVPARPVAPSEQGIGQPLLIPQPGTAQIHLKLVNCHPESLGGIGGQIDCALAGLLLPESLRSKQQLELEFGVFCIPPRKGIFHNETPES